MTCRQTDFELGAGATAAAPGHAAAAAALELHIAHMFPSFLVLISRVLVVLACASDAPRQRGHFIFLKIFLKNFHNLFLYPKI